jgi:hypothetical protein
MTELPTKNPPVLIRCNGCSTTWTGAMACHCAGQRSFVVDLLPLRDGDTSLAAHWNTHSLEASPHGGRIVGKLLADLVSAQSTVVEQRSLRPPSGPVFESVLIGGQWTQIRWSVVCSVAVDVVNVLSVSDPAVKHPVFVGLDIAAATDTPTQTDISVGRRVPMRFVLRNFLAGRKKSNSRGVAASSTRSAEATLGSTGDWFPAHFTGFNHDLSIQVTALCHRTFTGVTAFDLHRTGGRCNDPETLVTKLGEPRLVRVTKRYWSGWGRPGEGWSPE